MSTSEEVSLELLLLDGSNYASWSAYNTMLKLLMFYLVL
jgi:hypothetical protein